VPWLRCLTIAVWRPTFTSRTHNFALGLLIVTMEQVFPRILSPSHGRYSSSIRALRSGDRIPVGSEIFCTRPDRPWSPSNHFYSELSLSFQGVKRLGRGTDQPIPSSAEVNEKVQPYLYSPFRPSWLVTGWPLLLFHLPPSPGTTFPQFSPPHLRSRTTKHKRNFQQKECYTET
jgi:hypothetical protein